MRTLLNIQASPRPSGSVSRALSDIFIDQWKQNYSEGRVLTRDLVTSNLPFVDGPWVIGAFMPEERRSPEMIEALKVSDSLVAELKSADDILIGTPMFNYAVPAVLKAYIDQVVRFNVSFAPGGVGLLTGKRAKIIIASGRLYTSGAPEEKYDFESGYLKRILAYIGIIDVEVLLAGGNTAARTAQGSIGSHIDSFKSRIVEMAK